MNDASFLGNFFFYTNHRLSYKRYAVDVLLSRSFCSHLTSFSSCYKQNIRL